MLRAVQSWLAATQATRNGRGRAPRNTPEYAQPRTEQRRRRPNAVQTLVNSGRVAEGTPIVFLARLLAEHDAIDAWLADDPKRSRATWSTIAVQGPGRWEITGQDVLWEIAWRIQDEESADEEAAES